MTDPQAAPISLAKPAIPPKPGLSVLMADVEPEEIQWLWYPYIPRGKLTIIEGDPGVGKSWLTMELAAQVSRGGKLPGMTRALDGSRTVLLLTAEDGAGDTLRPRLDALQADVWNVHAITSLLLFDENGTAKLEKEITNLSAGLVIIDPIVAYLPTGTDMNNASSVRPILARLAKIAERTGTAIVIVRHLSKGSKDKALYRGLGSIDFTAAARSVLLVGFDPSDTDKRVLAHAKSNLAKVGPSQGYTIRGDRLVWAGRSSLSAEDLGAPVPDADVQSALEEAKEFVLGTLADGPKPALLIQEEAAKLHISHSTLRRAKGTLGVNSTKEGDHWVWQLPQTPKDGSGYLEEGQPP